MNRKTSTPRPGASAEAGFTLIEILVAMLVFLTGVVGLYALLSTGLAMQHDGLEMSRAGRRVEEIAQLLQRESRPASRPVSRPVSSEGDRSADVVAAKLPDGTFYRVTWLPGPEPDTGDVQLVEIRVARTVKGLDRAEVFTRLLSHGPSMTDAVEAWRARRAAGAGARAPFAPPPALESR